jgi:hypothetical protein
LLVAFVAFVLRLRHGVRGSLFEDAVLNFLGGL